MATEDPNAEQVTLMLLTGITYLLIYLEENRGWVFRQYLNSKFYQSIQGQQIGAD
jgi:hypothetical protein